MKKRCVSPFFWQDLVSGRRRGPGAVILRGLLRLAETPYTLAMSWRNRRYDQGRATIHRANVPVVSVGNITLGGTGKTPLVQWIAKWFRAHNARVAIISRGYRAEEGGLNDEARELEENLPDVPHLQNPDRAEAAKTAIEELETQLIVLDDGFQHRRLARDLDIVLLDAMAPFGFGHVFPRGALREPLAGLSRADVIILSRADAIDASRRDDIRRRVQKIAPKAAWAEVRHAAKELISADGTGNAGGTQYGKAGGTQREPLDSIKNTPAAAFCGIGNPAGFRHTIQSCGYALCGFREFPDHHCYARADLDDLAAWADSLGAEAVLCTHKDLVKIGLKRLGNAPLWAIGVEMDFLSGQEALENRLLALLARIGLG
jgi:tetraacyldisaccharide 4'-kinase